MRRFVVFLEDGNNAHVCMIVKCHSARQASKFASEQYGNDFTVIGVHEAEEWKAE